ncbi:MAG: ABC transporter substrate-binding protein [Brevinema sp.]
MFKNISLLLSFVAIGACATTQKGAVDTLTIALDADAVSLDAHRSNDPYSLLIRANIFDRLIERDSSNQFIPSLAVEWSYVNPTTLRMKLREGVVFQNGEPFTAEDVRYSFERALVSPDIVQIVAPFKGVEIIDDYTVNIILKYPFAATEAHLAHGAMSMVNQKAIEDAGDNVVQLPVGTGPFSFKEWNRGQNIVLTANDQYWGDIPQIKTVELLIVPEASARIIALETGDIDVALAIDPVDRDRVVGNSALTLLEGAAPRVQFLAFNIGKGKNPAWKNPRVREAVALSLDTPGLIHSVLFETAKPAGSLLEESIFGAITIPPIKQNIEQAKQILKDEGITEGMKVSLWTLPGVQQKIAEVIQGNLKEIGMDASIEVYELGRYIKAISQGEQDLYILYWTTVTLDGNYGLYNLLHSSAQGVSGNRMFYSNPEVDKLLDQARSELKSEARKKQYQRIQEIIREDYVMIPIFYPYEMAGVRKNVKNFGFNTSALHSFKDTYKE